MLLKRGRKVALLGGSFDPAHLGHLQLSLVAMRTLALDEVWWLVSPQNPLKAKPDYSYSQRVNLAATLVKEEKIKVVSLDHLPAPLTTISVVEKLVKENADAQFVWLMGADCLATMHTWPSWQKFAASLPFVVFARASFDQVAAVSPAAVALAQFRFFVPMVDDLAAKVASCHKFLSSEQLPRWLYLKEKIGDWSSTKIKEEQGKRC